MTSLTLGPTIKFKTLSPQKRENEYHSMKNRPKTGTGSDQKVEQNANVGQILIMWRGWPGAASTSSRSVSWQVDPPYPCLQLPNPIDHSFLVHAQTITLHN